MEITIKLNNSEKKDLESFCKLNNLNYEEIVKKSYLEGFRIEKYGLLSDTPGVVEKEVVKEVIKYVEVPKEVEKEVVKIEYVEVEKPVEKIVEIIKEVPVDRIVEKITEVVKEVPVEKVIVKEIVKEIPVDKIVYITDQQELQEKIFQKEQDFEQERKRFSNKVEELENIFQKEKNELLLKLQEIETKEPEVIEVIKEVPVEKIVVEEKVIQIESEADKILKSKLDALQTTVQKLKQDNIDKDSLIKDYEKKLKEIQSFQEEKKAIYLKNSNLDDTLYIKK